MTDDIVERLREEGFVTHMARLPRESKILHDAADEIERLRREVQRLQAELAAWADAYPDADEFDGRLE